jgi:sedoheptulose-bisphosphatase
MTISSSIPDTAGTTSPSEYHALTTLLQSALPSHDRAALRESVVPRLVRCVASIAVALRSSQQISLAGTANAFGDDQLNVDVLAEDIIRTALAECPAVVTASSEEDPVEKSIHGSASTIDEINKEVYTVAFDPLDGSSIIAPNWTVGTIVGVWDGPSALGQPPSTKQIAAILGVYGPRTTAIVALRVPGATPLCFELGLESNKVSVVRTSIKLQEAPFKSRYFAPANIRAAADDENYLRVINHFVKNKYTLRYSGGLVPDVVHILVKDHGIYMSPVTSLSKAKLRRLYELAPIALIVECAGGTAVDPADGSYILDHDISDCDERAGLICGTMEDVKFVTKELLRGRSLES